MARREEQDWQLWHFGGSGMYGFLEFRNLGFRVEGLGNLEVWERCIGLGI